MGKYFGTDGFRGKAGVELTSYHAYKIGRFLGHYLKEQKNQRVRAAIGKDTRLSSYMLEYGVASGLASSGADSYLLHVTTTPSVSYITASDDFDIGIMISASHNSYEDNGIKIVNSNGEKVSEKLTDLIEEFIDSGDDLPFATNEEIGKIVDYYEGRNRYIGYLIGLSKSSFKNMRIGLDLSNGSAHMIGKSVFDALGAKTYVIGNEPNGININKNVGSTNIEALSEHVIKNRLDFGFAFDGDADRCIAVDEKGNVVDGDHIMYILAKELKSKGELKENTVVTTIMSNLGLIKAFDKLGINYKQTNVGDRFVYECMSREGYCLGGEQSGHIIMSKYATTGDGILTAIKISEIIADKKCKLSDLTKSFKKLPQEAVSVLVRCKEEAIRNERLQNACGKIEKSLKNEGRILLRASGTENKLRVMVEAKKWEECRKYVKEIVDIISKEEL